MADQLLSQADVDALVSSLTRAEPAKPVVSAAPAPVKSMPASAVPKPAGMPAAKPQPAAARPAQPAPPAAPRPVQAVPSSKPAQPVRQEQKVEVSVDMINTMNAKIADITRQLAQVGTALKRIEVLEKKASEMESKVARNAQAPAVAQKVEELSEAIRKISTNLKGTPGYGVKHTFNCEKCSDQGHVAVMYRCTKCGHERWYGWWPEKK